MTATKSSAASIKIHINNLLAKDQQKPLLNAVAGCLQLMPQSMLFFASNRNAFRRLELGNATTVSPCWGSENRSVAVRIPQSDEKNLRLEPPFYLSCR